ncbi:tetratricopeptide repeat protein [Paenochrobactrum sp. BZR 588]|uniref:tetratricopeptide repeat protein n=1 Tax=unclassified Paenochrobactrum TaxID=2639760 RepID=UPI0038539A95
MRRRPVLRPLYAALSILLSGAVLPVSGHASTNNSVSQAEPYKSIRVGSFAGAYLAGRVAENDNNMPATIDFYRQALAFDPGNLQLKQDLMLALLTNGQFEEALPWAKELQNNPEIERFSRLALAVDAISRKQYRQARPLLDYSVQSDMDKLSSQLIKAWANYGAGNPKNAAAAIEAIKGPQWFKLFRTYNSALMADLSGQVKAAEGFYQKAVADKAGGGAAPDTYERIVISYTGFKARHGDIKGAIEILKSAEELLTGRKTLAEMRYTLEAGKVPERLIANPQQGAAEVLYSLGTAINRSGAEAFAKLYLQMSLPLRPDDDATLFQLGDISAKLRQPESAIDYYGRVPESSFYRNDAEMQLALNLAESEREKEAIAHLTALLERDKKDMRTYLALGSVYAQAKDYANSAKTYDQAVALIEKPERADWTIYFQRGISYERLKEWEKAEPNFKQALELFPDQPQVLNYLGYSWVDMGINLEEALDMIRKAVELRPQDGYITDSLGWAYYKLGRYDDAVAELEKAVKLRPEDATINDHLGDAYWQAGRQLEATFQWNHAIAGKPEPEELAKIEEKLKKGLSALENPVKADTPEDDKPEPKL